jgi:hypothetical protein
MAAVALGCTSPSSGCIPSTNASSRLAVGNAGARRPDQGRQEAVGRPRVLASLLIYYVLFNFFFYYVNEDRNL